MIFDFTMVYLKLVVDAVSTSMMNDDSVVIVLINCDFELQKSKITFNRMKIVAV